MKKILIPTDFSEVTENALQVATEIARKTSAEVELLHIIEASSEYEFKATGGITIPDGMNNVFVLKSIELAQKKLKEIMNNVKYVGVRFIPKIIIGNPYHHFSKEITKEDTDLIIMATEGSTGFLNGLFVGTNSDKVVNKANCMVLTVKNNTKDFKIRNVIFATDFKDDSPEFLEKLNQLQEIFDFKLHLLYVNPVINYEPKVENLTAKMEEFAKKFRIKDYDVCIREDITEYAGITGYAEEINADIIALSTHQHKGLHWLKSISDDLVHIADKPILTYKTEC